MNIITYQTWCKKKKKNTLQFRQGKFLWKGTTGGISDKLFHCVQWSIYTCIYDITDLQVNILGWTFIWLPACKTSLIWLDSRSGILKLATLFLKFYYNCRKVSQSSQTSWDSPVFLKELPFSLFLYLRKASIPNECQNGKCGLLAFCFSSRMSFWLSESQQTAFKHDFGNYCLKIILNKLVSIVSDSLLSFFCLRMS
jgi:hypothetical protein